MTSKTTEQMSKELAEAYSMLLSARTWKHYKGGIYTKLEDLYFNSDNGDLMVSYQRIDGPNFEPGHEMYIKYVRPFREFFDTVEVDGETVRRFQPVKKAEVWVNKD